MNIRAIEILNSSNEDCFIPTHELVNANRNKPQRADSLNLHNVVCLGRMGSFLEISAAHMRYTKLK
jgi:hypothetical protein